MLNLYVNTETLNTQDYKHTHTYTLTHPIPFPSYISRREIALYVFSPLNLTSFKYHDRFWDQTYENSYCHKSRPTFQNCTLQQ